MDTVSKKPHILVVDDNLINIKVTTLLLKEYGYHSVDVAHNGQQALDLFLNGFDLILLDIGLPDISGLDVCRIMREKLNGKKLPIVVLTAHGDQIKQECLDAGADAFLAKPIDIHGLVSAIKKLINE